MNRRTYELIAACVKAYNRDASMDALAVDLANAFADEFRTFKKQTFLRACGCCALTLLAQEE